MRYQQHGPIPEGQYLCVCGNTWDGTRTRGLRLRLECWRHGVCYRHGVEKEDCIDARYCKQCGVEWRERRAARIARLCKEVKS